MTDSPRVFITHIAEEAELALILKDCIRTALPQVEVFVSSDIESIDYGDKWLQQVFSALGGSNFQILLCSAKSVGRPWVNFEAGAGWMRQIPVVPVCHTDLKPGALPVPLSGLQGIQLAEKKVLRQLLERMAKRLKQNLAVFDLDPWIAKISRFERRYGFMRELKQAVSGAILAIPELDGLLGPNPKARRGKGKVSQDAVDAAKPHLERLTDLGVAIYRVGQASLGFSASRVAAKVEFEVEVQLAYEEFRAAVFESRHQP